MLTLNEIIESFREDVEKRLQGIETSQAFVDELISRMGKSYVPSCHCHLLEIAKHTPWLVNSVPEDAPAF